MPRFSISQISTLNQPFDDDLASYADAGVDGIGVWEMKLPERDDAETAERIRASGLDVTVCVAAIPSILPLPIMPGPDDPAERVEAFCASLHRLARFEPLSVALLTGPPNGLDPDEARRRVVDALRTIAGEARSAGVTVALEPIQGEVVTSLSGAVDILAEAGTPEIGILFDVWHLWQSPTLYDDLAAHGARLAGVHVCDVPASPRGWADRVLPGEGVADVPRILAALERSGWAGPYDLEIFSDDGSFGNAYEGSLWAVPGPELAQRGRAAFETTWERRGTAVAP